MFGGKEEFLNLPYLVTLNRNWKVAPDQRESGNCVAIDKAKGKGGIIRPSRSTGPPIPPELVSPYSS
jgi:hypothetical protein